MAAQRIEPQELDATINGLRLHYLDWGEEGRPPLVLLHGFSAMARYWDAFAVAMRRDYHVYALDQRGHGDSEWATEYGPDAMPSDLLEFVDGRGLRRFSLVGHSMGGGVAFRFAAEHAERVDRLVIVDSALPNPERIAPPNPDNSVQRSLAKDTFASEDEVVAHLLRQSPNASEERVRSVVPRWFRRTEDGSYTFKFDPALRNRFGGSPQQLEAMRRAAADLRAKIRAFPGPTLVLRGGNSDILSPQAAEDTVAALNNATLVTVPNTGHNIPSDDSRAFRREVRAWLGLAP